MTENKNSDQAESPQSEPRTADVTISLHSMRRVGLEEIQAALAKLSDHDLAGVLITELDRRRLDDHSNPTDPPGLYKALETSLLALLRIPQVLGDEVLAGNLAAVGRGVQVRSTTQDASVEISEVAELVDAFWEPGDAFAATKILPEQRAGMLAKTLAKRFGREVAEQDIEKALKRRTRNGAIADVVIAVGIKTLGDAEGTSSRDNVRRSVDASLKQRSR